MKDSLKIATSNTLAFINLKPIGISVNTMIINVVDMVKVYNSMVIIKKDSGRIVDQMGWDASSINTIKGFMKVSLKMVSPMGLGN